MDIVIRGRRISRSDLQEIQDLLRLHWLRGRRYVSRELCRLWDWKQPNGALKDSACRAILLKLERQGLLCLPPRQSGGIGRRPRLAPVAPLPLPLIFSPPPAPLGAGSIFGHIQWHLAISGAEASLYKELMDRHHYLGWRPAVGPTLRYIAYVGERPIGCLGWSAAAWKVAVRDQWIGWSAHLRQKRLPLVVNNTRFLVLERLPHLASHLLATNIRHLRIDWPRLHGDTPVLLETFVDTTRFRGTCYKAANWIFLGHTQGRGKWDQHHTHPAQTVKAIFVYPLYPDAPSRLCHE